MCQQLESLFEEENVKMSCASLGRSVHSRITLQCSLQRELKLKRGKEQWWCSLLGNTALGWKEGGKSGCIKNMTTKWFIQSYVNGFAQTSSPAHAGSWNHPALC